jgi:Peptidase S24-like.
MPRLATLAVIAVLVAAALGHAPVSVHYATSDSMEPTIGEGDVFLVTEGSVEVGDVALFYSTSARSSSPTAWSTRPRRVT